MVQSDGRYMGAAHEAEVFARDLNDICRMQTPFAVVSRQQTVDPGLALDTQANFPAQIGCIQNGGVEAEGTHDAVNVSIE